MIIKISKAVWLFSLLATMSVFLYNYASLPEDIVFSDTGSFSVSRNAVFYLALGLLAVINSLVFVVPRIFPDSEPFFLAWFCGLVTFLNLFIIVALQFISLYNSQERFNYQSIGYIIYGSLAMVVLWSSIWPVYGIIRRFTSKQAI
ncbi:MAG: hypothetical protein WDN75_07055 [Bacteroidota bacterium]